MDPNVLARKQLPELKSLAAELQMRGYQRLRKADLIDAIVKEANRRADPNQRGDASNGAQPSDATPLALGVTDSREIANSNSNGSATSDSAEQLRLEGEQESAIGSPVGSEGTDGQPTDADGPDGDQRATDDGPDRQRATDDGEDGDDVSRRRRRSRRERRRRGGPGSNDTRGPQGREEEQPQQQPQTEMGEVRTGVLDVLPEGYGFLRTTGYLPGDRDAYVSQSTIRKMGLRRGDIVAGPIRQQKASDKVPALAFVQMVNNVDVSDGNRLPPRSDFKDMTPLFPDERLHLETPGGPISMRIVDLMSPIGKGQRGLIVSPPKAGKTTILKELGQAIVANNPEVHLMVVLVDERPEEVTDMQRSVKGEIVASTFDRPADDHTQIAELAMERAKRLVEQGHDVVVLLDSITRLARAYNLSAPASGRIMSGGVDSTALYPPKRFFGAARNIEEGGSLTIIATALIETGSKMDEVIFEEFKGTGNMELRLDRRMEQKRIFPAIDIDASGTRKEELLLDREELAIIWKLRRVLAALEGPAALELLIDKMKSTRSNNQFLQQIQKSNLQA
jgi:transcription termination factor Rho